MSGFRKVATLDEIRRLGSLVVKCGETRIALFRTEDDRVFAAEDKCPHKAGPLSQGIVHGCRVTCPLHNMVLDLETGFAVAPDVGKVRTFPAKVDDGAIWLDTSGLAAAA